MNMKQIIEDTRAGRRAPKYQAFAPVALPDRTWPSRTITKAPSWLSTDLRDGNQALFEPMNGERKLTMFKLLVSMGFKEIEVAFPSASETDFQFVRQLIEEGHIPHDVTIGVLTQAREELIERTMESVRGAPRAIVHLYNAVSPVFRRVVFSLEKPEVIELAVRHTRMIKQLADRQPATKWIFQYSPELFTNTELEFARDVCNAVVDEWNPVNGDKVILNLPATVESCTPNVYADQIEWMHRHLARRQDVILSLHPHNDRGTAVAAAELGVMAGADRVEGCLFGNGERTGNVDLVTLGINLYTQGVDPELDFSDIDTIARTCERCTQLPVHPRHPWAGDLVFTAFSGSHQDAIKKGFAAQDPHGLWEVPYLPIDPADLGRGYDAIVRVNSQSGKGGIAFLLESSYGLVLPRRHLVEFSGVVQKITDESGREQTADALWKLFEREYLQVREPIEYVSHTSRREGAATVVDLVVRQRRGASVETVTLHGSGNGPIDAALAAMGRPAQLQSYEERALSRGSGARAVAFIEMSVQGIPGASFGAGVHEDIVTASLLALVSGYNRLAARVPAIAQAMAEPAEMAASA